MIFFGTPEFAVPTLRRLLEGPHAVVAVVSQPDRPRGRGRRRLPSPVSQLAEESGTPLLRPEKVGAPDVAEALGSRAPDLGVVVAFGQFLPRRIRELPALGYLVNAHASLLPRHRGAAPVARAILAGDDETGISVMRVEREMDAGPVTHVRRIAIGCDETAGELEARLATLAAEAIAEALERIASGRARFAPQEEARATLAPKIGRDDARLELCQPAVILVRRIRAMAPRPGAFTLRGDEPLRILRARATPGPCGHPPGRVELGREGSPRIATGEGWLLPEALQRPGGRVLPVEDFQRGRGLAPGEQLGGSPR